MNSKLILIAGGTASGKTTISERVVKALGDNVVTLPQDIYYRADWDELSLEERLSQNFDHPDAFDWHLIKEDIEALTNGKTVTRPEYIYHEARHNKDKLVTFEPKDVIIFEGLFGLFYKEVRDMASIKIYVDAEDDVRILRRLKRDSYMYDGSMEIYGTTLSSMIQKFSSNWLEIIKPMHDLYIEPTKRYAEIIIPNNSEGVNTKAISIMEASIKDMLK